MVTQHLLPIGYSYGKRLHSSTEIKKIQRRHHYHLVNKKRVLPFGHLELNNNYSLNILVTAMPIQNHCNKT
jgi:hypothetical protein